MKEDKILDNLHRIIREDEVSSLINEDLDIPIPKRIRDMVTQAQINLKREKAGETNPGLLDKLTDMIGSSSSTPVVSFGADGTEEEEKRDDPLKELLDDEDKKEDDN